MDEIKNEFFNKISFFTDDGEEVIFEVIEETKLAGVSYLLVSPSDTEGEVLILKDVTEDKDSDEVVYEIIEEESEAKLLIDIFKEMIDDIEIY